MAIRGFVWVSLNRKDWMVRGHGFTITSTWVYPYVMGVWLRVWLQSTEGIHVLIESSIMTNIWINWTWLLAVSRILLTKTWSIFWRMFSAKSSIRSKQNKATPTEQPIDVFQNFHGYWISGRWQIAIEEWYFWYRHNVWVHVGWLLCIPCLTR